VTGNPTDGDVPTTGTARFNHGFNCVHAYGQSVQRLFTMTARTQQIGVPSFLVQFATVGGPSVYAGVSDVSKTFPFEYKKLLSTHLFRYGHGI
jgi:hypothetical protein